MILLQILTRVSVCQAWEWLECLPVVVKGFGHMHVSVCVVWWACKGCHMALGHSTAGREVASRAQPQFFASKFSTSPPHTTHHHHHHPTHSHRLHHVQTQVLVLLCRADAAACGGVASGSKPKFFQAEATIMPLLEVCLAACHPTNTSHTHSPTPSQAAPLARGVERRLRAPEPA